jgi:sulfite reductase alpha subunit-like flavoprotein
MYRTINETKSRMSSLSSRIIQEENSSKSSSGSNSKDSTEVVSKPPLPDRPINRYNKLSKESSHNPLDNPSIESEEITIGDSVKALTQNTPQFIDESLQESRFE